MEKNDVALIQLERAIRLYLEGDFISALTLAGAAEEILGKQIKSRLNAFEEQVTIIDSILTKWGVITDKKDIRNHLNYPRNSLKHLKVGEREDFNYSFTEAALELIERAISNYIKVTSYYPDDVLYKTFIEKTSGSPNQK